MKINLERGIRTCGLEILQPVLRQWQRLNEDTSWFDFDDAPWWYNERASLSLFAGAIWKCKGSVFEEFSIRKSVIPQQVYSGRCDIEFSIGDNEFMGEAKQCWALLNKDQHKILGVVKSAIEMATEDIKRVPLWENHRKLGMVFACPLIHIKDENRIEDHLKLFIEKLLSVENLTIAWVFPESARKLKPPKDSLEKDFFFPGVVVILNELLSQTSN